MIGGGILSICWAKEDESLYFLKLATFIAAILVRLGSFEFADDLERPSNDLEKD